MVTYLIIGFTVLVTYKAFKDYSLFEKAKLSPYACVHHSQYERLISHMFVHVNWEHLIFNMLTMFFFGGNVEAVLKHDFGQLQGVLIYLLLYLAGGVFASLYSLYQHKNNVAYSAVGASGAVSAVLFASILFFPNQDIYLFFIPIGIPAYIIGPLYLFYSAYMAKKGMDNIGHDAHFWGAVWGFVFPILWNTAYIFSFFDYLF